MSHISALSGFEILYLRNFIRLVLLVNESFLGSQAGEGVRGTAYRRTV